LKEIYDIFSKNEIELSKYYNCIKIKCNKGNDILAPDQIHSLIYEQLKESGILNG